MKKKNKGTNQGGRIPKKPGEVPVPNKLYFEMDEADLSGNDFKNNTLDVTETDDDEDEGVGDGNLGRYTSGDNPLEK